MNENYITIGNRIQNNTLNPDTNHPYPNIDKNYGPYNSLTEAYDNLPMSIRAIGLKFAVFESNDFAEYIFDKDLENANKIGESNYEAKNGILIENNIIKIDPDIFYKGTKNIQYKNFNGDLLIKSNQTTTEIYSPIDESTKIKLGKSSDTDIDEVRIILGSSTVLKCNLYQTNIKFNNQDILMGTEEKTSLQHNEIEFLKATDNIIRLSGPQNENTYNGYLEMYNDHVELGYNTLGSCIKLEDNVFKLFVGDSNNVIQIKSDNDYNKMMDIKVKDFNIANSIIKTEEIIEGGKHNVLTIKNNEYENSYIRFDSQDEGVDGTIWIISNDIYGRADFITLRANINTNIFSEKSVNIKANDHIQLEINGYYVNIDINKLKKLEQLLSD